MRLLQVFESLYDPDRVDHVQEAEPTRNRVYSPPPESSPEALTSYTSGHQSEWVLGSLTIAQTSSGGASITT